MAVADIQHHPLVSKLASITRLSEADRAALVALPLQVQTLRADQDIVRDGDRVSRSCLLLEGYACRNKVTGEGKRQIISFHIPGEIPDLQSVHLKMMDHNLQTLTVCKVGFVAHEHIVELCAKSPSVAGALWRETLIDAAIFREWVVNVGRRDAIARMAHVFCELFQRMKAVGRTNDGTCEFPISQTELADALGLSTVHTNRTLQELRAAGLVALAGKTLTVRDWEGLKNVGDFDPSYLHQQPMEDA
jgi:CRP-like cAMP-binding protein